MKKYICFSVLLFLPFAFVHPCILFFAAAMFSLSPSFLPCSCLSATAARKKTWGTKPSNFITEKQRIQPQSGVIIPRGEIHPSERLNLIEKCIDKSGNSVYHYVCTIFASVLTFPPVAKDLAESQNIIRRVLKYTWDSGGQYPAPVKHKARPSRRSLRFLKRIFDVHTRQFSSENPGMPPDMSVKPQLQTRRRHSRRKTRFVTHSLRGLRLALL